VGTDGGRAEWLDLHKLRVFATVAEYEHYSRAADVLRISQPALSVHVRDLERHFGVALFERAGRNVRLTDAGRVVHGYARRLLALASELDEVVADLRGLRAGQLRLGASTTIGEYILPAILGAFRRRYPGVGVAVEIANTGRVADRLRHGELHLALLGEPLTDPELLLEPYRDDALSLIVPPGHPWARRVIAPEQLAGVQLVAREAGSATRDVAEAALATLGVRPPIALELGGTEAVKGAVAAGLGVAFVSACAVAPELAAGRLAEATVRGLTIRRQFQVARRRGRRLTAPEEAFLAFLRAEREGDRATGPARPAAPDTTD
jgi:LysR family transcriptional regulator, transcriptional activator of the cysJI operon